MKKNKRTAKNIEHRYVKGTLTVGTVLLKFAYVEVSCSQTWGICTRRAGKLYKTRSRCAVRIPDKSSKTDGTGSSLPDLDKKTVTLRSLD